MITILTALLALVPRERRQEAATLLGALLTCARHNPAAVTERRVEDMLAAAQAARDDHAHDVGGFVGGPRLDY